jgi:type IV pilus assembly protein PilV
MPARAPRRQTGFSLVELTVATAIYSMGLGSLSLMLLLAVQGTSEARMETTAATQAGSLAEMILLTSDVAGHYAFPPGPGASPCDPAVGCSVEQMAAWQLDAWRRRLAAELPSGQGLVCHDATPNDGDVENAACSGAGERVIKIFWKRPPSASESDPSPARHVLRLP